MSSRLLWLNPTATISGKRPAGTRSLPKFHKRLQSPRCRCHSHARDCDSMPCLFRVQFRSFISSNCIPSRSVAIAGVWTQFVPAWRLQRIFSYFLLAVATFGLRQNRTRSHASYGSKQIPIALIQQHPRN